MTTAPHDEPRHVEGGKRFDLLMLAALDLAPNSTAPQVAGVARTISKLAGEHTPAYRAWAARLNAEGKARVADPLRVSTAWLTTRMVRSSLKRLRRAGLIERTPWLPAIVNGVRTYSYVQRSYVVLDAGRERLTHEARALDLPFGSPWAAT